MSNGWAHQYSILHEQEVPFSRVRGTPVDDVQEAGSLGRIDRTHVRSGHLRVSPANIREKMMPIRQKRRLHAGLRSRWITGRKRRDWTASRGNAPGEDSRYTLKAGSQYAVDFFVGISLGPSAGRGISDTFGFATPSSSALPSLASDQRITIVANWSSTTKKLEIPIRFVR
jgi:hypothetical protein